MAYLFAIPPCRSQINGRLRGFSSFRKGMRSLKSAATAAHELCCRLEFSATAAEHLTVSAALLRFRPLQHMRIRSEPDKPVPPQGLLTLSRSRSDRPCRYFSADSARGFTLRRFRPGLQRRVLSLRITPSCHFSSLAGQRTRLLVAPRSSESQSVRMQTFSSIRTILPWASLP